MLKIFYCRLYCTDKYCVIRDSVGQGPVEIIHGHASLADTQIWLRTEPPAAEIVQQIERVNRCAAVLQNFETAKRFDQRFSSDTCIGHAFSYCQQEIGDDRTLTAVLTAALSAELTAKRIMTLMQPENTGTR